MVINYEMLRIQAGGKNWWKVCNKACDSSQVDSIDRIVGLNIEVNLPTLANLAFVVQPSINDRKFSS